MKKMFAILVALMMVCGAVMAAAAEEPTAPTFMNGVQFGMDMDQVMERMKSFENLPAPDIDTEVTRGNVVFTELEYEKVDGGDGLMADIKFKFAEKSLVAIHYDFADGTDYEAVKALLAGSFGETVPFDAAQIGNGKYAIDDDGDLKDYKEMIVAEGVVIVLEQDHDGDVDVTLLDPAAAYINQ